MSELGDITELARALARALEGLTENPVEQQMLIEVVTARHCVLMNDTELAYKVADGVHKHVRQLIQQWRMEELLERRQQQN